MLVSVKELIDQASGIARQASDWRGLVAVELAEWQLDSELSELGVDDDRCVQALNLALYPISYEAALACEYARDQRVTSYGLASLSDPADSSPVDTQGPAASVRQRLDAALTVRGRDPEAEGVENLGQLARVLSLGLIDAYEARDRYDYDAMQTALDACDDRLPPGYTLKSFTVLECMAVVAQAGLSREQSGSPPSRQALETLATRVSDDRDVLAASQADHALIVLVSAVGHMLRRDLVDDVKACGTEPRTSCVDWVLGVLQGLEERGVAQSRNWPTANEPNLVAHHVHYYRHFAHHVRAIALADRLKAAAGEQVDTGDADTFNISAVRDEYENASASLERALQLVPASNEARWRYYDLNAENLEHEESLRLELLEQRLSTRRIVTALAEANVERLSELAKEELRNRMADVSMRIVEIIGVFLAVVAILGATVASATVGDLTLTGRILILVVGGTMPVLYFVLLRWIVTGRLSKRRLRT